MFAKIEIKGIVESLTGMHIGGSSQFAAIGAVDSPVIRDVFTDQPMIPGSSLKGKMRTLLARQYNEKQPCAHSDDDIRILRLFGSAKDKKYKTSRLIFSDMVMANAEELKEADIPRTEVKFENTINRLTAVANPRQIERAVKGGQYELSIIYNVDNVEEMKEDFETFCTGLKLLQFDYIGGHGSRGYGKIAFKDLDIECVVGQVDDDILDQCKKLLKEVG